MIWLLASSFFKSGMTMSQWSASRVLGIWVFLHSGLLTGIKAEMRQKIHHSYWSPNVWLRGSRRQQLRNSTRGRCLWWKALDGIEKREWLESRTGKLCMIVCLLCGSNPARRKTLLTGRILSPLFTKQARGEVRSLPQATPLTLWWTCACHVISHSLIGSCLVWLFFASWMIKEVLLAVLTCTQEVWYAELTYNLYIVLIQFMVVKFISWI